MLSSALTFFKRFLKTPGQVGAVLPSSPFLANTMAQDIRPGDRVLEIGAGTGSLTRPIAKRIADASQLTAVEMDTSLADIFHARFPNVRILTDDAETILTHGGPWDAIISGIPFAVMEPTKRDRMFRLISEKLSADGVFVMFQYSLTTKKELERIFKTISIRFVPINVPPAFVYVCREPRA